ncbi:hypothetical protein, partial [Streptomyces griseus]|uniref:hypothetical protein n=1 Tax=Streptomyces griseus TaxID=1911 RepID=UPI0019407A75
NRPGDSGSSGRADCRPADRGDSRSPFGHRPRGAGLSRAAPFPPFSPRTRTPLSFLCPSRVRATRPHPT